MTHLPYVAGAYAVFVLILLWDWLAARRQLRAAQRLVQMQEHRLRERRNMPAIDNTRTG
ncbi:MAG TPA: heme exporter protein CcmD [Xylella sp.]